MVAPYASFNNFYCQMLVGFCLNTEKRFFLELLFQNQQKDLGSGDF